MQLNKDNLCTIVRDTRKSLGLTQAQLAERAGCSQRLVSDLERGKSAEFGKVLAIFDALQLRLVPTSSRQANPREEVDALEESVASSLRAATSTSKRKLSDYLQE